MKMGDYVHAPGINPFFCFKKGRPTEVTYWREVLLSVYNIIISQFLGISDDICGLGFTDSRYLFNPPVSHTPEFEKSREIVSAHRTRSRMSSTSPLPSFYPPVPLSRGSSDLPQVVL